MNEQSPLHIIFSMQRELNIRYGLPLDRELTDEEINQWLLQMSRCMGQEIAELTDSCKWKHWKQNQELDKQNAKVEAVDLLHFIVTVFQILGMTADDVFEAYLKKNKVNHERQDTGYIVKDENDCRHI
jgi:dimeric dUTPase (all-alpha-NTP-PPase superfamily)